MRGALIALAVIVAVAALLIKLPLGFALQVSGATDGDVKIAQARGTVWNGQLVGITHAGQNFGTVQLSLKPFELLKGQAVYQTDWTGRQGGGSGKLTLSPRQIHLSDARFRLMLSEIEGVQPILRQTGGTLNADIGNLVVNREGCRAASGTLRTDAVQRLGATFNRQWPELTGDIQCEGRVLVLPLEGTSSSGEAFLIETRLSAESGNETRIRIIGLDGEASLALLEYGFEPTGGNSLEYLEILE